MKTSIWTRLDLFPPLACRLLARRTASAGGIEAKSVEEISKDSGLTPAEVNSLSWAVSWDNVPVHLVRKFSLGCGIDFTSRDSMRIHSGYLRRNPTFKYLRKHPRWSDTYEPLIRTFLTFAV